MRRAFDIGWKAILVGMVFRFFTGISPVGLLLRVAKKTRKKVHEKLFEKKQNKKETAGSYYEIH